jgi:murein DD-endopeptidase MepM/ murein hydrolase activator NlpD
LDIAVPTGTPVLAADDGMVVSADWSGNYGELIEIDHGGGKRTTWYAHLSSFAVSVGDTVHKGQVIGYSGDTGYSTGPHLHYEVHENGEAVDPLSFYK